MACDSGLQLMVCPNFDQMLMPYKAGVWKWSTELSNLRGLKFSQTNFEHFLWWMSKTEEEKFIQKQKILVYTMRWYYWFRNCWELGFWSSQRCTYHPCWRPTSWTSATLDVWSFPLEHMYYECTVLHLFRVPQRSNFDSCCNAVQSMMLHNHRFSRIYCKLFLWPF